MKIYKAACIPKYTKGASVVSAPSTAYGASDAHGGSRFGISVGVRTASKVSGTSSVARASWVSKTSRASSAFNVSGASEFS